MNSAKTTAVDRRLVIEHAATDALADSNSVAEATHRIIRAICETLEWACGACWMLDSERDTLVCAETWGIAATGVDAFLDATKSQQQTKRPGGLIRRVWLEGEPVWIPDVTEDASFRRAAEADKAGLRSAFSFPIKAGAKVIGVMEFFSHEIHRPDAELLDCTLYIGSHIGQFCQRIEAQERLSESEELFQSTIEMAAIGIAHVALDGRFIHANRWLCELLGYTREELLGLTVEQISHPEDKNVTDALRAQLHAGLVNSFQVEKRYLRKDGSAVWIGLTVAVKRGASGNPVSDIFVWEDISARKQAAEALRLSEERFRSLVNLSSDWYWEQDADLRFTWSSNEQMEKAAARAQSLLGQRRWDLPDLKPLFGSWDEHKKTVAERRPYRDFELLRVGDDGAARYLSVSGEPIFDERGNFRGYRGTGREITQHKRDEHLLRLEHTVTRCLSDADSTSGALTGVIRAVCETEGWPCGEYWGVDESAGTLRFGGFWDALDAETRQIFRQAHQFEFAPGVGLAGRIWQTGEPLWIADVSKDSRMLRRELARDAGLRGAFLFPCMTENKAVGVFAFWSRAIREPDERLLQAIRVIGSQIGQFLRRKQTEERIQYLATHDGLTALPNRVMFHELLCVEIESARRYERKFAVLFIDLDRFKFVNDTLGHQAGDSLLAEMSARLRAALRASDVIARLGGDEFVVLLREVRDPAQVTAVVRKILSAALKPMDILGQECRVTASIGIALYPSDAQDEQSLMKNADLAMYLAKEEGKNNYQFYSAEIQARSIEKLALESGLRGALERNEFSLQYQAKLDLRTEIITGVEALLRWNNPELGAVTPMQFIPVAEETGLIVPVGKWVLETACAQNVAWQRQGLPALCMAVNLSPRQFADPDLVADLSAVLKHTGLAPELLELEITESMVMHNTDRAVKVLSAIKTLGVRLAIDDFGTGYSSLAQLKRFPIDTLKVDRSFIRDIPDNTEDKAITEAIIALGCTLGLTVVAEGVETKEQQTFLREQSCDEMQGYYFSKPVVPERFAELLLENSLALKPS
jgi:diguanylate cyclase (GGDEF)-like protein/PAS domain S-box-containing protein